MITVAAAEARTRIAELLDRAERGETVVITRDGQPGTMWDGSDDAVPATGQRLAAWRALRQQLTREGVVFSLEDIAAAREQGRR